MKKKILRSAVLLSLTLFSCNSASDQPAAEVKPKVSITMKGSDTVLPVGQKEAEEFMKTDSNTTISVIGGGSGVGISALLDGTTDIAMASRDLKTDEKIKFDDKKMKITETVIGYDALSVIVNPSNKVTQLTREQLDDIFTGKITNWKEVGGDNMKIVVYTRESSSGTFEFFKESVMEKKNYASSALSLASNGAIAQSVSQTPGAIGYIGLAYVDNTVHALNVSYDQGKTFVAPSIATAKDKTYPITRPLYYFYDEAKAGTVKGIVDYTLSDKGQSILKDIGYIPLN